MRFLWKMLFVSMSAFSGLAYADNCSEGSLGAIYIRSSQDLEIQPVVSEVPFERVFEQEYLVSRQSNYPATSSIPDNTIILHKRIEHAGGYTQSLRLKLPTNFYVASLSDASFPLLDAPASYNGVDLDAALKSLDGVHSLTLKAEFIGKRFIAEAIPRPACAGVMPRSCTTWTEMTAVISIDQIPGAFIPKSVKSRRQSLPLERCE